MSAEGTLGEVSVYLVGLRNPLSNVPPFPERGFNATGSAHWTKFRKRPAAGKARDGMTGERWLR